MTNQQVAHIFRNIGYILEIQGENPFRIRAYERAARNIEGFSGDISAAAIAGELETIPGIGKDLASKIKELVSSGRLAFYEDLLKNVPAGVLDILQIPNVGPKTAKVLFDHGIKDIAGLEKAIASHALDGIEGMGRKTLDNMLAGIAVVRRGSGRMWLADAARLAGEFVAPLSGEPYVHKVVAAGSLRRCQESVRDIDILVASSEPGKVMERFISIPGVARVQEHGDTKSSVRTAEDVQVDCRVIDKRAYGAALVYFTGSKEFNVRLRQLAQKRGYKVNEYGVFKNDRFVCGATEEEVFKVLGLDYIEPELRQDNGEIALAAKHSLPALVSGKDIAGDLHVHSTWSDGVDTIAAMAEGAAARGYGYIAVTDHSQSLKIAKGLSAADLVKKRREIDRVNERCKPFRVLFGTEVDIGADGELDYPDDVLREFEFVVAAVHSSLKQPPEQITRRIVAACRHPFVHCIAHPTCRLRRVRDAVAIDLREILAAAADNNTALEINSSPDRLDLNDIFARQAKRANVKICVNTDAHSVEQLDNVAWGLAMARRGWLTKGDVLNTLPADKLLKTIKK